MYRYIWKIKLNDNVSQQDFIKFWKESSGILQEYPGAKGTKMHAVRDEPRAFLAVAEWESMAARDAMQADIDAGISERAKQYLQFKRNEEWGDISFQAGAEQIDIVLPKNIA